MQVCTSLQTYNHASTPPLSFLQAGCPSCGPTNSVKALKAYYSPSTVECNATRRGLFCYSSPALGCRYFHSRRRLCSGDRHMDDRVSRVRLLVAHRVRVRQRSVSSPARTSSRRRRRPGPGHRSILDRSQRHRPCSRRPRSAITRRHQLARKKLKASLLRGVTALW